MQSVRAAVDLVVRGRCLCCVPASCISALAGAFWRQLTEPACSCPWSILWREADVSDHVRAIVTCAQAMSQRLAGWQAPPGSRAERAERMAAGQGGLSALITDDP